MKKYLALVCSLFTLCGFDSLSGETNMYQAENKTPDAWEIEQNENQIKAYNQEYEMELVFYVDAFMPNSPQCRSNKRIKDIKFDIDVYKRAQKGDTGWAKMIERIRIVFSNTGFSEEKRIYGSTLIKNSAIYQVGDIVQIGTLQFLAPLTCSQVDNMTMRVSGLVVRGRSLPPLEIHFKLA